MDFYIVYDELHTEPEKPTHLAEVIEQQIAFGQY